MTDSTNLPRPPATDLAADAALASELVRAAGSLAAAMRTEGLAAEQKTSVSDIVTAADKEAERLVVERLRERRPDDGIIGEEGTNVAGTSGRSWVIDPVDGTYNFFSGLTYWCSAIALTTDAGVLLGAIYHPHDDLLWVGGPDLPSTRNGQALPPLADNQLAQISASSYLNPAHFEDPDVDGPFRRAAGGVAALRMLGSGSMDLAAVADGRIGCWFQHSVPAWDWLPGRAIVAGVGGSTEEVAVGGRTWSVAGPASAVAEIGRRLVGP